MCRALLVFQVFSPLVAVEQNRLASWQLCALCPFLPLPVGGTVVNVTTSASNAHCVFFPYLPLCCQHLQPRRRVSFSKGNDEQRPSGQAGLRMNVQSVISSTRGGGGGGGEEGCVCVCGVGGCEKSLRC